MTLLDTLQFIASHPMNRERPVAALARFARWQIRSRIGTPPFVVPFVDDTRLLVTRGMTGATGNIYCGLHEYQEMAFVAHVLRPLDLFVDGGANVGTFTVLASGVAGADAIAIEPVPQAFDWLRRNIALNGLEARVECQAVGLARKPGLLRFSADRDTMNRVIEDGEQVDTAVEVPVRTLDDVCGSRVPTLVKLDVEGYETEVLMGASGVLANPGLRALIVEVSRPAPEVVALLEPHGFSPYDYDPRSKSLAPSSNSIGGNVLFVRDVDWCNERARTCPPRRIRPTGSTI